MSGTQWPGCKEITDFLRQMSGMSSLSGCVWPLDLDALLLGVCQPLTIHLKNKKRTKAGNALVTGSDIISEESYSEGVPRRQMPKLQMFSIFTSVQKHRMNNEAIKIHRWRVSGRTAEGPYRTQWAGMKWSKTASRWNKAANIRQVGKQTLLHTTEWWIKTNYKYWNMETYSCNS